MLSIMIGTFLKQARISILRFFDQNHIKKNTISNMSVTGEGLTAAKWILRLESNGYYISPLVKEILSHPDYDAKHRLTKGKQYNVTMVRNSIIRKKSQRNHADMKKYIESHFMLHEAYEKAELTFLIREKISNIDIEKMNAWTIDIVHEPLPNNMKDHCFFNVNKRNAMPTIDAFYVYPFFNEFYDGDILGEDNVTVFLTP